MQVSCSENLLSETIIIHWRTKDEFQKSISSSQMIYFYKSYSDAVLRQLLQFLSTLYKELFEDCSSSDSTNLKKDDIWMKLIQLRQWWHTFSIWWWRNIAFNDLLQQESELHWVQLQDLWQEITSNHSCLQALMIWAEID